MSKRDDLFAAVYAEPDSDDPRIVLADYLMGEGDPRGDFIAKQLAGDHEGAEPLLAKHGAEWLGSLRPFTHRVQFKRGFPTRLELVKIVRPGRIDLDRLVVDPALGTIEDLLNGSAHHDVYGALIASPMMTALRRIEVAHRQVVIALRQSRAKIAHIACVARSPYRQPGDREWVLALLELCERRRDVASLAINGGLIDLVLASPIAERLTSLAVTHSDSTLSKLLARLPKHLAVSLVPHAGLELCIADAGPYDSLGALDLVRDGERMTVRGWGAWAHGVLRHYLQYLPGLDRIELHGRSDKLEALERAARLFRVELTVLPERPRHGYVGELAIHARSDA